MMFTLIDPGASVTVLMGVGFPVTVPPIPRTVPTQVPGPTQSVFTRHCLEASLLHTSVPGAALQIGGSVGPGPGQ
jgi:hypothetical protein